MLENVDLTGITGAGNHALLEGTKVVTKDKYRYNIDKDKMTCNGKTISQKDWQKALWFSDTAQKDNFVLLNTSLVSQSKANAYAQEVMSVYTSLAQ